MKDVSKAGKLNIDAYLASRKKAAAEVNPKTAEVWWQWADPSDPYCLYLDRIPAECQNMGRVHFASSPGSHIWIAFCDLPASVRLELWDRLQKGQTKSRGTHFYSPPGDIQRIQMAMETVRRMSSANSTLAEGLWIAAPIITVTAADQTPNQRPDAMTAPFANATMATSNE